ncbi:hypothetical protein HK405_004813 [Cladochytrium tenue]|nr:hypothetical protein HK405_004813 [Cladochytrium tenue]
MPVNSRSSAAVAIALLLVAGVAAMFALFSGNSIIPAINSLAYLEFDATNSSTTNTAVVLTLWGYCITSSSSGTSCTALPLSALVSTSLSLAAPDLAQLSSGSSSVDVAAVLGSLRQQTNTVAFLATLLAAPLLLLAAVLAAASLAWRSKDTRSRPRTVLESLAAAIAMLATIAAALAFAFLLAVAMIIANAVASSSVASSFSAAVVPALFVPLGLAVLLGLAGSVAALRAAFIGRALRPPTQAATPLDPFDPSAPLGLDSTERDPAAAAAPLAPAKVDHAGFGVVAADDPANAIAYAAGYSAVATQGSDPDPARFARSAPRGMYLSADDADVTTTGARGYKTATLSSSGAAALARAQVDPADFAAADAPAEVPPVPPHPAWLASPQPPQHHTPPPQQASADADSAAVAARNSGLFYDGDAAAEVAARNSATFYDADAVATAAAATVSARNSALLLDPSAAAATAAYYDSAAAAAYAAAAAGYASPYDYHVAAAAAADYHAAAAAAYALSSPYAAPYAAAAAHAAALNNNVAYAGVATPPPLLQQVDSSAVTTSVDAASRTAAQGSTPADYLPPQQQPIPPLSRRSPMSPQ